MKLLFVGLFVALVSFSSMGQEATPFEAVDYSQYPSVIVMVDAEEYYLLGINGVKRKVLMAQCETLLADTCREQFANNFKATMNAIGYPVGDAVELRLYKKATHQISFKVVQL